MAPKQHQNRVCAGASVVGLGLAATMFWGSVLVGLATALCARIVDAALLALLRGRTRSLTVLRFANIVAAGLARLRAWGSLPSCPPTKTRAL